MCYVIGYLKHQNEIEAQTLFKIDNKITELIYLY